MIESTANDSPLTPLRFLQRSAEVFPDKEAIVYGRRSYTYREFADHAELLAAAIASRITPGDRVAYLAPNLPEMLIAHFAVPLSGGVLVALNSRLAAAEISYILQHSGATLLFVDAELIPTVASAVSDTSLATVIEIADPEFGVSSAAMDIGQLRYHDFLAEADVNAPSLPWTVSDERDVISINYTSGTTGKPKGVMYTHRGAYLNAFGEVFHNSFNSDTVYLWTLPMFHCNGWCTPWAVTAAAATHVCLRAVRADALWNAIDNLGVTHLCGAPTVCSVIGDAAQAHVLRRPLRITTAGAPPSPTVIERLDELGVTVVHVYGLTEVYGPFTICEYQREWDDLPPAERARKLSRQGVGMLQAESARVVDEQMCDVPADGVAIGEIVLRGNNVMAGYYSDPTATAEAFRGDWFHSGDLGVMHADGYIELMDRAKDIIISGGENISTIEVENAVLSHPAVGEAAVIGATSARWGERPRAFVVLRPGATATAAEVIEHVHRRLARYKAPDEVIFVEALPRTATGKIRKSLLREDSGTPNAD